MQRPILATAMLLLALGASDGARGSGAPAETAREAGLAEHAPAIADYTLRAALDVSAHVVRAEGTIVFRNASVRPLGELWLHLYLNAFKAESSAFLRERVGGRGSGLPKTWGRIDLRRLALRSSDGPRDLLPSIELHRPGDADETDARVPLPREIAPGEAIELDVAFDDTLPSILERTGYSGTFHMVGQWFPKLARLEPDGTWAHFAFHHLSEFYADFGTYDVTIDVPSGYTIGATGPVVERREERGRVIERHVQADVHDFAWTAWDQFRSLRESVDGVDVTVLYPRGFEAVARRDLAAVRFALPYESRRYGPYPYGVLTVVHPEDDAREAGGMEYPTLITTVGPWWIPPQIRAPEIVTVHELGHQWFYGLVATNEAAWPFLDEGLNQYAEVDAMAAWYGAGSAADLLGLRVSDASLQAVAAGRAAHDETIAQPASAFSSGRSYSDLVYSRTAAILTTFARVYGEDAVGRALGAYARENRFRHPGPPELLDAFEGVLGREARATLSAALFDKAWVDYSVGDVWSETRPDGGIWAGSVLVRRRGTLSFPIDVELVLADGSARRETWDGHGDWKRIAYSGPTRLVGATVDPDDRIVLDQSRENNHGTVEGRGGGARRSLEWAAHAAGLLLQAVSP